MKKILPGFLLALFFAFAANAQTVLVNPATDGGFETGATFAANGWTLANDATNTWNLGTVPGWFSGSRGAYISNNAGIAWTYGFTAAQRSHFYRDVTFPAGESVIKLEFDIRANGNDGSWDNLLVYIADNTILPTATGPTATNTTTTTWPGYTNGTTGYFLTQYNGTVVPATTTHITYNFTVAQGTYAAGATKRLIFTWKNDGIGGTNPPASIDNISLISSCSGPVTSATTAITQSGATLNWAPLAGATGYNVQYRVVGSTTWINAAGNPFATNTAVLTGLSASTNYEYQVAATGPVCTAYSVSSAFTTLCGTAPLPWSEGFEGVTTVGANIFPNCWTRELITGTNSPGTYGTNDTYREPHSGTKLLYTQWNTTAWVYTPGFAVTAGTAYKFSFWMKNKFVTTPPNFTMDVSYGNAQASASMTNALQSSYTAGNANWVQFSYIFTPTSTGTIYLGIKSTSPNSTPWYLSFDDFKMQVAPTCTEPATTTASAITFSTATISWTPGTVGTAANGYDYFLSTSSTPPANNATPTGSVAAGVTTLNLTALTPSTNYYIYIRSKCSSTDISDWSGGLAFTTPCQPLTTLSWTEGFEGVTTVGANIFPNCWSRELITGTNSPGTYGANDTYREPHTGTKLMYTQWNTTAWVYTPGFVVTAGVAYKFSFWMKNKFVTTPVNFTMDVAYGTAQASASMTNSLQSPYTAGNSAWTLFSYDFTPTTSGTIYFGIKSTSPNSTPWYLSFDDFMFEQTTPCPNAATTFTYASTSLCTNGTAVSPVVTGTTGGAFSSTAGLSINTSTGAITPATSTPGTYVVTYTVTGAGACANLVKTTNVSINSPSLAPTSATSTNTAICGAGGTVTLTANGGTLGSGASFKWYKESCGGTSFATGATVPNVVVNATTTFYVRAEGACNNTDCASVTVNVYPNVAVVLTAASYSNLTPATPSQLLATVSPPGNYTYQFRKNGTILTNNTTSPVIILNTDSLGAYEVTVFNIATGCSATSNLVTIIGKPSNEIYISPNPGNGLFNVRTYADGANFNKPRTVSVYDNKGGRVFSRTSTVNAFYMNMQVDMTRHSAGTYFVIVTDADGGIISKGTVMIVK